MFLLLLIKVTIHYYTFLFIKKKIYSKKITTLDFNCNIFLIKNRKQKLVLFIYLLLLCHNQKVHKDFRLWLTSMPSLDFPVAILQNGVKMTLEPPRGLRANLVRAYLRYNDKYMNDCSNPEAWKRLLFATCLFHAVIQERRKFGPLGWNIQYDFTDGDLSICQVQVQMFLNEYPEIPYKVIFCDRSINSINPHFI